MLPSGFDIWSAVKQRVAEYVTHRLMLMVRFATLTATSSKGESDSVAGFETEGGEENTYSFRGQRVQHFGFSSVPPLDLRGVSVLVGGSGLNGLIVAEESAKYAPTLVEGEVAIFSKASGAVVKIDTDGKITITAPAGQDVVVNGGTLKVARDTDPVSVGTWTHVPAAGVGVTPCSLTYTPPAGAPTPIVAPGVAVTGKITDGAARFKG